MTNFKFEAWPTEFRTINQYFGANPQNYAQFGLPGHEGLDFMAPDGSKVFAVAPGTVASVHTVPSDHPYGIHVRINHIENYQTTYGHLRQAAVTVGQVVTAGTLLGLADNTGNSFGSHLHLTLKKLGENYLNWPSNITDPTPFTLPLLGWETPAGPYVEGWASLTGLTLGIGLAQVNSGGINLRAQPSINGPLVVLVPAGTIIIVTDAARGQYVPVKVPRAAVGLPNPTPPPPAPPPSPTTATVDGWGFATYLTPAGGQAIVGEVGINLRAQPSRTAPNIGLVKGGSTVTLLGAQQGEYRPVRVRQEDFQGAVVLPNVPPAPAPTPAGPPQNLPPANMVLGWAFTQNIRVNGQQAVIGALGINLRAAADQNSAKLGLVKEGAITVVVGPARGVYTPIWARKEDILDPASPMPVVALPDPFPAGSPPPPPPPAPAPDNTPGWAFTTQMVVSGQTGMAGQYGLNLRQAPRRDAAPVGFIPANAAVQITGPAMGEYSPVRVDDRVLQPPFGSAPATTGHAPVGTPAAAGNADPQTLGDCRIGLHASADPNITEAEFQEFADLRPGIIKVLSFHSDSAIRRLAQSFPDASWVVRAFLDFGGRNIGPQQFVTDTLPDVQRSLNALPGKDVVVELHNEPNIIQEGLGTSWADGASFATWWLDVLGRYRQALPGARFIYPGLSPGSTVSNLKQDHIQFVEASRAAVEAADGLAVHLYWSSVSPLGDALNVLDDFISRFRFKLIWITEASNNKAFTTVPQKAQQYLQLWHELQNRPTVKGVTFFVASASNRVFAEEIWVGRGIGAMVGRR